MNGGTQGGCLRVMVYLQWAAAPLERTQVVHLSGGVTAGVTILSRSVSSPRTDHPWAIT